ncbi:MAG: hypothetical protein M1840_004993 [Geoglossum simile]|nr:MAG: hypothetical protein M1840_004993 [Geoglossum simile]
MDHISRPGNPSRSPIQVPYLVTGKYNYDGLGFSGFPERRAFDVEKLKSATFQENEWDDALSFLQGWAFFGMLTEILGGSGLVVEIEDFIHRADGLQFITTRLLPYYLRLWASHESILSADAKEECLNYTDRRLAEMHRCINSIAYAWGTLETEQTPSVENLERLDVHIPSVARDTLLSIIVLGESLSYGRYHCYGVGVARPFVWARCWFLDEWMLDVGWCRYEIARMEDKFIHHNACSYYLSLLDRTHTDKDHRSCTWESCLADQVDVKTYRTKHVQLPCTCDDAVEDSTVQRVRQVISEEHTPTLTISKCRDIMTTYEIKVHHSGPHVRYVAISHVWSDGLGNNQRNSLPLCQMLRLQTLVDNLYGSGDRPVPFWIDTICVPLEPVERKAAIIALKRTYEEADKVLVLDSTLQEVADEAESTEALMRIASSSWIRRLWTFQEGALSKSLHFQFANQAVTYDSVIEQRQREIVDHAKQLITIHRRCQKPLDIGKLKSELAALLHNLSNAEDPIFFEADREIREVRNGLKAAEEDNTRLIALCDNIKWRTTSKPEDEFICLATLLGRNIKDAVSCPHEERMKWLFSSLSSVPASIIFHDRPRVQQTCYRWIPTSVLNSSIIIGGDAQTAIPSPDGLRVTYPGLLLLPNPDFYESEPNSPIFLEGPRPYAIYITGETSVPRRNYKGLQLAMVFEDFSDRSMEYVPKVRGLLVVITKREPSAIFARIELPVLFERMTAGATLGNACRTDAQAVPQNQVWCVG